MPGRGAAAGAAARIASSDAVGAKRALRTSRIACSCGELAHEAEKIHALHPPIDRPRGIGKSSCAGLYAACAAAAAATVASADATAPLLLLLLLSVDSRLRFFFFFRFSSFFRFFFSSFFRFFLSRFSSASADAIAREGLPN